MKHDWVVTDSQGYCMQCTKCGIEIVHPALTGDLRDGEQWDKHIDAECPKYKCFNPGTPDNYRKEMLFVKPIAILSTTVLPVDGVYEVRTVDVKSIDIMGVPHYIGHPATKAIVENMGAVPASSKLFPGLKPGEAAVCFSIKQGRSTRRESGFTSPHQDVSLDDLDCRVIRRLLVAVDQGTGERIIYTHRNPERWEEVGD